MSQVVARASSAAGRVNADDKPCAHREAFLLADFIRRSVRRLKVSAECILIGVGFGDYKTF